MISRRDVTLGLSTLGLGTTLGAHRGIAQPYPTQDIHFVCGFAAGSGADIIVRFFAEKMRPLVGRPIVVENKPGASGSLATEYVARSKPDGHTIQIAGASSLAANMHLFRNPPIDYSKAITVAATISQATDDGGCS